MVYNPLGRGPMSPMAYQAATGSGIYNLPFNPTFSNQFAEEGLRGSFDASFDAFLDQYMKQFGGSNFFDFLRGTGRRSAEESFNQRNAGILASGGTIFDMIDPLEFLKTWNASGSFNALRPQERGENPAAFGGFTRYLAR